MQGLNRSTMLAAASATGAIRHLVLRTAVRFTIWPRLQSRSGEHPKAGEVVVIHHGSYLTVKQHEDVNFAAAMQVPVTSC
jgi:hypothetical protein